MSGAVPDLVQLKWQHIRGLETRQNTEKQNISLRKQLTELQASKTAELATKDDIIKKLYNLSIILMHECKSSLKVMKEDLGNTITAVRKDTSNLENSLEELTFLGKMASLGGEKQEKENIALANELDLCRKMNAGMKSNHALETERLQMKITKLSEDLGESDHNRSVISQDNALLQEKLEKMCREKEEIDLQNSESEREVDRLRVLLELREKEISETANIAEDSHEHLTKHYEDLLSELQERNAALQEIIAELKDQLAKLMGNKTQSHFAKFVEVKKQNVNLQGKLKVALGGAEVPRSVPAAEITNVLRRNSLLGVKKQPLRERSKATDNKLSTIQESLSSRRNKESHVEFVASRRQSFSAPKGDGDDRESGFRDGVGGDDHDQDVMGGEGAGGRGLRAHRTLRSVSIVGVSSDYAEKIKNMKKTNVDNNVHEIPDPANGVMKGEDVTMITIPSQHDPDHSSVGTDDASLHLSTRSPHSHSPVNSLSKMKSLKSVKGSMRSVIDLGSQPDLLAAIPPAAESLDDSETASPKRSKSGKESGKSNAKLHASSPPKSVAHKGAEKSTVFKAAGFKAFNMGFDPQSEVAPPKICSRSDSQTTVGNLIREDTTDALANTLMDSQLDSNQVSSAIPVPVSETVATIQRMASKLREDVIKERMEQTQKLVDEQANAKKNAKETSHSNVSPRGRRVDATLGQREAQAGGDPRYESTRGAAIARREARRQMIESEKKKEEMEEKANNMNRDALVALTEIFSGGGATKKEDQKPLKSSLNKLNRVGKGEKVSV